MLQNRRFSAWGLRSGFGAAIYVAVVRNSIAFWNSVSADRSCWHVSMACLLQTCIDVTWLSGIQRGECSCSAHAHVGMFKWHVCSKPAKRRLGCQVFSGESAAVLLMLMLACLSGMLVRNLHKRDLAVSYSSGSLQLCCSRSCWHA